MPRDAKPEKRDIRTLRTLIVLDPMSGPDTTQDDELQQIVRSYEDEHGLKLEATLANVFDPAEAERAEMIVFDWGGMSQGNDLLGHQIRGLTRWAEDHPSALLIIRSMLSWNELQDEIRDEQIPALPNVIRDDGRMRIPGWWLAGRTDGRSTPADPPAC